MSTVQHPNPHCRGGRKAATLSNLQLTFVPGNAPTLVQRDVEDAMTRTKQALVEHIMSTKEPVEFVLTLTAVVK